MGMRAVVKTAIGRNAEYVAKVMSHLFRFHIKGAKAFYTRYVDKCPLVVGQFKQFTKGSGVHARAVGIRYVGCAHLGFGYQQVEQCRFAHT